MYIDSASVQEHVTTRRALMEIIGYFAGLSEMTEHLNKSFANSVAMVDAYRAELIQIGCICRWLGIAPGGS